MNRLLRAKERFEGRFLKRLLKKCKGNTSETARWAGIHRSNLLRLLRKYNIKAADYRAY